MHGSVVKVGLVILGILLFGTFVAEGLFCDRDPHGIGVPKTPGDNGFKIVISGDPEKPDKYIPGAVYTVRLQGPGTQFSVEKFTGFLLVAEPTDGLSPEDSAGNFQLTSDSLARFSEFCPHAVKHASEVPKAEVQVQWIAPALATGCVSFRATIIKNKAEWFRDDQELTKQLCPENEVGDEESEDSEPCCACDEAKYELTFEGLWSPLTHPKEFPADAWSAHFSDIVGASHSPNFKFWQQNEPASEGLRQLAEAGDSKDLERELKDESAQIRTIIKARGLRHPNFYGHKTFAVFRADKDHNLVSLVSKIAPSPDWFVGVSALNLCLRNCSWAEAKVIPLYPWDAGTDNGLSYLSERKPTIPRERISRIVWNPKSESPFYDPSGNMVKPFAKLRIQKQRSYERTCDENARGNGPSYNSHDWEDEEDSYEDRPECGVTPWTETPCSATCGKGVLHRRRQFLDPKGKELGCNRKLTESLACDSHVPCTGGHSSGSNYNGNPYQTGNSYGSGYDFSTPGSITNARDDSCATTNWRPWGTCSKPCGRGIRRRMRDFVNPSLASSYHCSRELLLENEPCFGRHCNNNEPEQVVPGCETTEWGDWGPCSATICGTGMKTRQRLYANPSRAYNSGCNASIMETESCQGRRPDCDEPEAIQEICMLPADPGPCAASYTKWYFDFRTKACSKFIYTGCPGNANIFDNAELCEKKCGSLKDTGFEPMMKHQSYNGYGYNGNRAINSNSNSNANVNGQHSSFGHGHNVYNPFSTGARYGQQGSYMSVGTSPQSPFNNDGPAPSDCEVSEWGLWSKCSVDCGRGHKYRTRYITRFPQNGGDPCPKLEHRRKCKGTDCSSNHHFNNYHQQHYGPAVGTEGYGWVDGYVN